jgi:hypothetical protein
MNTRSFLKSCLAASLAFSPSIAQETKKAELPALESIFNGKDLTGWKLPEGNADKGWWKVVDGVLVGENDPAKKGSMLYTEKEYLDFMLEAEVRWTGHVDTGFMARKPEIQMQLGISGSLKRDMSGSFYLKQYPEEGQSKNALELMKKEDWNKFRLQAKGDTFTVWINGTKTVEYKNDKFPGKAPLGLQIHPNLAMKVEFRNIAAKEL